MQMQHYEEFDDRDLPPSLVDWFAQPQSIIDLARSEPGHLKDQIGDAANRLDFANRAVWDPEALGAAILDSNGVVLVASPSFVAENAGPSIDTDAVAAAVKAKVAIVRPVSLDQPDGRSYSALFAYASPEVAQGWQLPAPIAKLVTAHPGAVVLLTTVMTLPQPLRRACRAFGLTGLQERVALATIRTGNIKSAAAELGIAYATAREALSQTFSKTNSNALPAMVAVLAQTAFGVLPQTADADALLIDIWGLNQRQAALAGLVAEGLSRRDAARLLGISEAVAKKEIGRVFTTLNVSSAVTLARMLAEVRALSVMMTATGGSLGLMNTAMEPLRFVIRDDGSRIALSDYGPASGEVCFIVHSSMTTRLASRYLIKALQEQGFRPIAIDRPGFGMSDPVTDADNADADPFMLAALDHAFVADKLKIGKASFFMRGGGRFIIALDAIRPDLVGRVVIANPDPQTEPGGSRSGPFGAFKEAYQRNPSVISLMARLLASTLTKERMQRLLARAFVGSPPDEAAMQDDVIVEDLYRAGRMFSTGRVSGYVAEQIAYARGSRPEPVKGKTNWHILLGEHDTLHDPAEVRVYWQQILPDTPFETVAGAGRLLAMTHAALVAGRLRNRND
ncbi:MAG: hypothetical protein ACRCY3_09665 [Sphingorhabdus sp.]